MFCMQEGHCWSFYKCKRCWEGLFLCDSCCCNGATCPSKAGQWFGGPRELKGHLFKSHEHPGDGWTNCSPRDEAHSQDFEERYSLSKPTAIGAVLFANSGNPDYLLQHTGVKAVKCFRGKVVGDKSKKRFQDGVDEVVDGYGADSLNSWMLDKAGAQFVSSNARVRGRRAQRVRSSHVEQADRLLG